MAIQTATFEEVKAMSDAELSKLFGHDQELKKFKEGLVEIDKLKGEARKIAVERIEKMFTPHIYPGEVKYIAESAQRQANRKNGEGEKSYCGCDILD